MLLDKQTILNVQDLQTEDVDIPEWGGKVRVRGMTGRERDIWEQQNLKNAGTKKQRIDMDNIRARMCVMCIVDDNGQRIFDDSDAEELGQKNAGPIVKIADVAQRLSEITYADVEQLAKN